MYSGYALLLGLVLSESRPGFGLESEFLLLQVFILIVTVR